MTVQLTHPAHGVYIWPYRPGTTNQVVETWFVTTSIAFLIPRIEEE